MKMQVISSEYKQAVKTIKTAILQSQYRAAKSVNREHLPGLRGFSVSSIKNMGQFYEQWSFLTNRPPLAGDLQSVEEEHLINTT